MPWARRFNKLLIVLEMIKFEHTIFALPFAFLGAFLAERGAPDWKTSLWILVAMASARSAAMGFNRLVDRDYDARNPRTKTRALPAGMVSPVFVGLFVAANALLFTGAAWMLNPLSFYLSPVALLIVLGYSYTKRVTTYSHLFLGLSLGIAPVGGWIAVTGVFDGRALLLAAAVLFWVAGFDVLYACQDTDFDRRQGLHSIPERFGVARALLLSSAFHGVMVLLLAASFIILDLTFLSWLGLAAVSLALLLEHRLVKPNDLSRLNAAFFGVNGLISLLLFTFVGLDLCLVA